MSQVKWTAEGVAVLRAATRLDDGPVTHGDTFAYSFIRPRYRATILVPWMRRLARWKLERTIPGICNMHLARTRFFDDELTAGLARGVRNVVILGAGLDSRAYRLVPGDGSVRVWEVDLPANSAEKQRRVRQILGELPAFVTYVGADLSTAPLSETLAAAGLASDAPCIVLFEGVSMYLEVAAVAAVLDWVAQRPGSVLLMDFFVQDVFDYPDRYHGARSHFRYIIAKGEPYRLGFIPTALPGFASEHGLRVTRLLPPDAVDTTYLRSHDGAWQGRGLGYLGLCRFETPNNDARQGRPADVSAEGANGD